MNYTYFKEHDVITQSNFCIFLRRAALFNFYFQVIVLPEIVGSQNNVCRFTEVLIFWTLLLGFQKRIIDDIEEKLH